MWEKAFSYHHLSLSLYWSHSLSGWMVTNSKGQNKCRQAGRKATTPTLDDELASCSAVSSLSHRLCRKFCRTERKTEKSYFMKAFKKLFQKPFLLPHYNSAVILLMRSAVVSSSGRTNIISKKGNSFLLRIYHPSSS